MKEPSNPHSLDFLLKNMDPILDNREWIFYSSRDHLNIPLDELSGIFYENEGVSYIISKSYAQLLGFSFENTFAKITLNVYSDLETVGFTATISSALCEENISCNVVAAFHHDHIFINYNKKEKAMKILNHLSEKQ